MRYLLLALFVLGCGDTPDKDSPNNSTNNSTNNGTSNSTNNGTSNSTNNATSNSTNNSCTMDTDCSLGTVCQVQDNVCIVASCEFCTADQICYRAEPSDQGSCSAPECDTHDDCGELRCLNGVCGEGCVSNADCDDGEICNLVGQCEAG